ncbi:MAG TPA: hypothetical protein VHZ32_09790 [Rhizomicrobium sp.]|nr:hypothetical protein [Rhizomicrobium sp.]
MALAAGGRTVSLEELSAWRKDGLLPAMASSGLGTGRGKSYYWQEENIVEQAQAVHDAMRRHGRNDQTLLTLFLAGFKVPLPQLRRAWLHRAKLCRARAIRTVRQELEPGVLMHPGADNLLLQASLCLGAAMQTDATSQLAAMRPLLGKALTKLGLSRPGVNESALTDQLWHLLTATLSALETSDLVRDANDEELYAAQRHLSVTAAFLHDCAEAAELDTLAPHLFLFFLTLLRSGQTGTLERMMAHIEGMGWRVAAPAHSLALHA